MKNKNSGRFRLNALQAQSDVGLLVLRLALGGAMLFGHGLSKWAKLFGDGEIHFADPIGIGEVGSLALAVFAEVICSALILSGLLTRWAAIPALITMLVALFVVHGGDDFGTQEKALLYAAGYLTLLFTGGGKYSIDALLARK